MINLCMSTYYHDPKKTRAEKEEEDAVIQGKIEQIRVTFPRAGYRPLLHHMRRNGVHIGERKLRRVLKKFGLQIRPLRKFINTTDSNHNHRCYPNLLPELTVTGINQVWASDITYIRIENGFVYLAVVIDLGSRRVIGWAISKQIDGDLALTALKMAFLRRNPPRGVIHHSDRGVQYLCDKYTGFLHEHGFFISCSRKGNPYDNAWVESFMKTLKHEEIYAWEYKTYLDVVENLPYFIEEVYNKKRLHSSLGYLPPEEFEKILKIKYEDKQLDGQPKFTL